MALSHRITRAWNEECEQGERVSENFVNGVASGVNAFARAGGTDLEMHVLCQLSFITFFEALYWRVRTSRIAWLSHDAFT